MGKDSEAGEKLRIRGKENGVTGRKRFRGSTGSEARGQTRGELVPGVGKGEECHEKCREAGGDVDMVFCLFPCKERRSSALKRKGKEDWRSQKRARSSHGLNA